MRGALLIRTSPLINTSSIRDALFWMDKLLIREKLEFLSLPVIQLIAGLPKLSKKWCPMFMFGTPKYTIWGCQTSEVTGEPLV